MKELTPYYIKYKHFILPTVFIMLSFFILFRVIMPQVTSIASANQDIETKNNDVQNLQTSLSALSNSDDSAINDDLDIVTKALPVSKNITQIFEALSSAAGGAGVDLKEYSLKVGGIYGRAEKVAQTGVRGVPTVDVDVKVSGASPRQIVDFTKQIQERLPLSEVKQINSTGNSATLEVSFFYKPLDLTLVSRQDNVPGVNQNDLTLINQLKDWNH
ncbi:MAG TPA: hypothetical protein VHE53_02320 [Patescibacteria group bacterium]|nr:hypothetical protein [Patescibacteria group bacterium]